MKFIAVIPARGGSKRLPHKNILPLAGKPLICHSIEYALQDLNKEDIYVSTDAREIVDTVKPTGVQIIERPEAIAGDHTPTAEVLKHVSTVLNDCGVPYDYMILLQCTQPLRPQGMLTDAIEHLLRSKRKCLVGVSPLLKKIGKIDQEKFIPWNYTFGQRSQDMDPLYYENGLIYITHRTLVEEARVIDEDPYPYIIDHPYAQVDIDTQADFAYAAYMIDHASPDKFQP